VAKIDKHEQGFKFYDHAIEEKQMENEENENEENDNGSGNKPTQQEETRSSSFMVEEERFAFNNSGVDRLKMKKFTLFRAI